MGGIQAVLVRLGGVAYMRADPIAVFHKVVSRAADSQDGTCRRQRLSHIDHVRIGEIDGEKLAVCVRRDVRACSGTHVDIETSEIRRDGPLYGSCADSQLNLGRRRYSSHANHDGSCHERS